MGNRSPQLEDGMAYYKQSLSSLHAFIKLAKKYNVSVMQRMLFIFQFTEN